MHHEILGKMLNSEELEEALFAHDCRVKQQGVESAEELVRGKRGGDAELIIAAYRERIGEPLHVKRGLTAGDLKGWYLPKPDHDSPRWAYAKRQLGLPESVVESTSKVADEILARLSNPLGDSITTRGLVLGHVQSGKTTNFLSVAAKAADNGYHLIIVLAGVHNSLRRQTQDRAVRTLVHNPELWWLGTAVSDFRDDGNSVASHLVGTAKRGLLVVKKHSVILERLANWLERESDGSLRRLAVLVIDDEADQAGLDVSRPGDDLEGVHKQLSRIVNLRTSNDERRCAYLAYTATPYANILTSQNDYGLYPRDFIYPLEAPSAYLGSTQLFGDEQVGSPVQIVVDAADGPLSEGLQQAIKWFVLATAARAGLGQSLDSFHSSMLIHTTQSTEEQKAYRPVIEDYLRLLNKEFLQDEAVMEAVYERTLAQVPSRKGGGDGYLDEAVASWDEVRCHVSAVLERLIERTEAGPVFKEDGRDQQARSGVVVDNSKVPWIDRLTYSDLAAGQRSVTVIAIGGNTLSRGLTLEGLVCSYFARTARTYDSLMQMGRWFGFRPGYRHLLRIWTTQDLFNWFRELDQVEEELRNELVWMQNNGFTPDRYGPRIRVSPNMNITRAAAMRSVSRHVSYSDSMTDSAWLNLDVAALETNQRLARELAIDLGLPDADVKPSLLFREVPLDRIREFLFAFRFHPEERRIDIASLRRYMTVEATKLAKWHVLFKSVGLGSSAQFDYGGDVGTVNTVRRARVKDSSIAYIQSLVDSGDHRLDVGDTKPPKGVNYRSAHEPPLLVVYAIDPVSTPLERGRRVALDAPTTPISMSITFPESESSVEYVAPALEATEWLAMNSDLEDYHRE